MPAGRKPKVPMRRHVPQSSQLCRPPVVSATSMFAEGEVYAAEQVVRQFLQAHGTNIEAMRLLAQIGVETRRPRRCRVPARKRAGLRPGLSCRALRIRRRAGYNVTNMRGAARRYRSCSRSSRTTAATARATRTRVSVWAITKRRCACIGSSWPKRLRPHELHLSIAHALKTLGQAAGGHRGVSGRCRVQPELRRCLLESRQPQDLSLHRR